MDGSMAKQPVFIRFGGRCLFATQRSVWPLAPWDWVAQIAGSLRGDSYTGRYPEVR
jgi:hypothetical protein